VLLSLQRLVAGLNVSEPAVRRNMAAYGPFAAIEVVLLEAAKVGADRQEMHEVLRELAMAAWAAVQMGEPNPLETLLAGDGRVTRYLDPGGIAALLDAGKHTGIAIERACEFAVSLRQYLQSAENRPADFPGAYARSGERQ